MCVKFTLCLAISGERPFKCQICNLAFTTNGNMHRHMRVHEKEFAKSPQALKEMLDAGLLSGYSPDSRRSRKRRHPTGVDNDANADRRKRRSIEGASSGAMMKDDDETPAQVALKKKLGVCNGDESPSKDEDENDSEDVRVLGNSLKAIHSLLLMENKTQVKFVNNKNKNQEI
jgi:hypothetical protein